MSISGRRVGKSYEVMDERGVQRVIQLTKWGVDGVWYGEINLEVRCQAGAVVSVQESKSVDGHPSSGWNEEQRWDSVTLYTVLHQPVQEGSEITIFSAIKTPTQAPVSHYAKKLPHKTDVLLFKFDPEYPYEMLSLQLSALPSILGNMHDEDSRRQFDGRYVEACKELGILPDDEVLQTGRDATSLNLNGKGGGEKAVVALSKALQGRGFFRSITIKDSFMGCRGSASLCNALLTCPIQPVKIDLTGGNIKGQGTLHLANLIHHTPLKELALEWNGTGTDPSCFENFMSAIGTSSTLAYLDLRHNHITSSECGCIADMLRINRSLTTLDLRWNQITPQGSSALAAGMSCNTTLLVFHLSGNDVQFSDLTAIDGILSVNKTRFQTNPMIKHAHHGSASPDAAYRWARSGVAHIMSPNDRLSKRTQSPIYDSPRRSPKATTDYVQSPEPPHFSESRQLQLVRQETLQQRNEELAAEMSELRELLSQQEKVVETMQVERLNHKSEIDAKDDEVEVLEKRVQHLEDLKTQTEEMINTRDIAMNVLRDKAQSYQARLQEMTVLANGRDLEAVVEDIQKGYQEELQEEKMEMLKNYAREREQAMMERQEEAAVLKHDISMLMSKLAEKESLLQNMTQEQRENEEKEIASTQLLDDAREKYSALMMTSDNERRRLLKRIDDLENDVQRALAHSKVIEERLEQERVQSKTTASHAIIEIEEEMVALRNEKRDVIRQLTRSREQSQQLQANNEELQSKVKRMKDDQKHFQQRLEQRVSEQVRALIDNYSMPFNTLNRTKNID